MWLNERKIGYCICRIGVTKTTRMIYDKNKIMISYENDIWSEKSQSSGMFHGTIDMNISMMYCYTF